MRYTPIALHYVLGDKIHASSGVYITPISPLKSSSSSSASFILTINHIPNIGEYSIYANLGNTDTPSQVHWHRVSILEEVSINPSEFEFFDTHNQFKLYPRDQYGRTISILKLSSSVLNSDTETLPSPISTSLAGAAGGVGGPVATKSSISVGDQVTIVSSPFNFTNSLIFHQFTTTARIVYKVHTNDHDADNGDGVADYWLSDAAYMENMAGGAVIDNKVNSLVAANGDAKVGNNTNNNTSENKLVGLVLGNLRKTNGDGNLMVIIPLRKIV
ncbi:hypothetical protein KGF57_000968 [Candida theae]|uniref:Uncharacterized protein n=1 Tax=Candida theae TaxID=1198502 RepID=A0AAD5BIE3_9ASCO|nr:uncharacterized protein KGF57_000968 [Candida theae]KAI5964476.1 hypothetical protein KGF57_000968 [Candida theae]